MFHVYMTTFLLHIKILEDTLTPTVLKVKINYMQGPQVKTAIIHARSTSQKPNFICKLNKSKPQKSYTVKNGSKNTTMLLKSTQ